MALGSLYRHPFSYFALWWSSGIAMAFGSRKMRLFLLIDLVPLRRILGSTSSGSGVSSHFTPIRFNPAMLIITSNRCAVTNVLVDPSCSLHRAKRSSAQSAVEL